MGQLYIAPIHWRRLIRVREHVRIWKEMLLQIRFLCERLWLWLWSMQAADTDDCPRYVTSSQLVSFVRWQRVFSGFVCSRHLYQHRQFPHTLRSVTSWLLYD